MYTTRVRINHNGEFVEFTIADINPFTEKLTASTSNTDTRDMK